jgi:hypothetical protein
LTIEEDPPF